MQEPVTSISALFGEVATRMVALLRAEMNVFSAEMRLKLSSGIGAGVWIVAAGLFLLFAVALALAALLFLMISMGLKAHVAAAILALAVAALGLSMLLKGLAQLRQWNITPERTLAQWRNDANMFKRSEHDA